MTPMIRQAPVSVRGKIYHTLYDSQEFCSKQMLAARCGISMPTLYQNLNELMEEGLVQYSGEEKSTGGRKAQGLDIIPDARLAVGIAVSEHRLRLILTDLRLHELAYQVIPFDFISSLSEETSSLPALLEAFLDDHQVNRSKLLGVGITIPALITQDHSRIHMAPTLGIRDVPLEVLTKGIPYPVYVENDASASGFAEFFVRGASSNLAYFSLESASAAPSSSTGIPMPATTHRAGNSAISALSPAGCAATAGKAAVSKHTALRNGSRTPSGSLWKISSAGSNSTIPTTRRCSMTCCGISPSQ